MAHDNARTYAFIFVCQSGPLETGAMLLAASLKQHLRCDYELIAAIPGPVSRWGEPASSTLGFLGALGVRVVSITNDIDPAYPIGNKISCLRVATEADRLVFLDTDLLLVRPFGDEPRFAVSFAAKPADLPNVVDARQWRRAYAAAGLRTPEGRVATTMYGDITPPYFNAGFLAVDSRAGLGEAWLDCCKRIDSKWGIRNKRPHLDQIALPVALHKLKLAYDCLEEQYNFPVHLKPLGAGPAPLFAHYHAPSVLRREPVLLEQVRSLCDEHPVLAAHLAAQAEYAPMLPLRPAPVAGAGSSTASTVPMARSSAQAVAPLPEIIITGIPRSGTSYLCNLLHRFENCVVLNEPEGVSRPLRKEPIPYGVATFYRDIRRDILEGCPIQNKLRDGKVTDETMDANEQTQYTPSVLGPDFILGAKSPLGFLSRLHGLRRAMPWAPIVVCVRNPFDTIASWKTTFSHLKTADVTQSQLGGLRDPFLTPRQRHMLESVSRIKDVAWRRAAWWRYLAELVLDAGPGILLVPYPVAVSDPKQVTDRILQGLRPGNPREPIVPSTLRAQKRSALDATDMQAIRSLCGEAALALGVGENDAVPASADLMASHPSN